MEIIRRKNLKKQYLVLHKTSFSSVAFQVCTTNASIYINFAQIGVLYVKNELQMMSP